MEDRIMKLESHVAYLEHTVAELNEHVQDQQKTISNLEKRLDVLIRMYRQLNDGGEAGDMPHERPPHY